MIIITNGEGYCGMSAAIAAMLANEHGLDIVEEAIRLVEKNSEVMTVGRGGLPNMLGQVECDAALMHGSTLQTGAVGGLQGFLHPISVARAVMNKLPHELLIGHGACRFAAEIQAERSSMKTSKSKEYYQQWVDQIKPKISQHDLIRTSNLLDFSQYIATKKFSKLLRKAITKSFNKPKLDMGTTVFLVNDSWGAICAGVSTSGWPFKYPGRLGDSPVIGAGIYADTKFGACGCTGFGELSIRASLAVSVVRYLQKGADVQAACYEGLEILRYMRLSKDVVNMRCGVQIHAVDTKDNYFVMYATPEKGLDEHRSYCVWLSTEGQFRVEQPVIEIF